VQGPHPRQAQSLWRAVRGAGLPSSSQTYLRDAIAQRRMPDYQHPALSGHKRLNTTLTYARAYDQTVAEDYFRAMSNVERRLSLLGEGHPEPEPVTAGERAELLALAEQLVTPEMSYEMRLEIAAHMRTLLNGKEKRVESQDWVLERPPP